MNPKNLAVSAVVAAIVAGAVGIYLMGQVVVPAPHSQPPLGANSGPDKLETQNLFAGMTGGGVFQVASAKIATVTASQFCNNGVFDVRPGVNSSSLTFPTAADLIATCLKPGAYKDIIIKITSSTGSSVVPYGNTSTTLQGIASSSATATGSSTAINAGGSAVIRFTYVAADSGEVKMTMLSNGL